MATSCHFMATTVNQARRLRFATQLRNALDEDGSSIRALAKKLNPQAPETARSNLMRYLRAAHMPSRSSRREIALTLGLPADYFEGDDDEESDPVAALMTAINHVVRRVVREEVRSLA